jgi:pimeloyl-ACP methyl ester carboxylesterase
VAGHSAGGWASLVALRDNPEAIGAAVAFAPAAFDRAATRPPDVQALRRQRYAEMTAATRLPALIFGFDGDAFETAADLSALATIPGVRLVAMPEPGFDELGCVLEPHIRVRDLCFSETQDVRLRGFIAAMVAQRP